MVWVDVPRTPESPDIPAELGIARQEAMFEKSVVVPPVRTNENGNANVDRIQKDINHNRATEIPRTFDLSDSEIEKKIVSLHHQLRDVRGEYISPKSVDSGDLVPENERCSNDGRRSDSLTEGTGGGGGGGTDNSPCNRNPERILGLRREEDNLNQRKSSTGHGGDAEGLDNYPRLCIVDNATAVARADQEEGRDAGLNDFSGDGADDVEGRYYDPTRYRRDTSSDRGSETSDLTEVTSECSGETLLLGASSSLSDRFADLLSLSDSEQCNEDELGVEVEFSEDGLSLENEEEADTWEHLDEPSESSERLGPRHLHLHNGAPKARVRTTFSPTQDGFSFALEDLSPLRDDLTSDPRGLSLMLGNLSAMGKDDLWPEPEEDWSPTLEGLSPITLEELSSPELEDTLEDASPHDDDDDDDRDRDSDDEGSQQYLLLPLGSCEERKGRSLGLLASCQVPESVGEVPEAVLNVLADSCYSSPLKRRPVPPKASGRSPGSHCLHRRPRSPAKDSSSASGSPRPRRPHPPSHNLRITCETPRSPDSGLGSSEPLREEEEALGPKFFADLCRVWPDIIVRLAHDITLESPSVEDAPDPPDPPSQAADGGRRPSIVLPAAAEEHPPDSPRAPGSPRGHPEGKCCSDEDPCCPQLLAEHAEAAAACGSPKRLPPQGGAAASGPCLSAGLQPVSCPSPICGSPAPRRPRAPPPGGSSGPSSYESVDSSDGGDAMNEFFPNDMMAELAEEEEEEDEDEEGGGAATPPEDDLEGAVRPLAWHQRPGERKRRKLPEIPKNKKYDSSSPDSELRLPINTDIDSGNSTQHSPDGAKSMSPQATVNGSLSPMSPASGGVPFPQLELLEATHRGLYRFIPRHHDEVEIEIGDPIYVQKEADDLWCEGVNLRTGRQGIFPGAHVTDVDYSDFDPTVPKVKKERYLLNYLGSIETLCHKGNQVLCQAVRKIAGGKESAQHPHPCILEVSDQGIRMVDKSKPAPNHVPCHDYFYHLKHVSFCAFHPKDHRYFGFITKHPTIQRFACHVFRSNTSTRPVAEAVGRAFQRFYQKFIETAYPIEDIYLE
ncbi:C-Jun-amino-terminal kinase-interacting protein 2-like isoform X2 [Penaeus japonicus]|uniref:C-Jun-amino-terminal kinase-interacting protein 2-like isoform X2 n=1 Tax=Penaeus japonicus TaxID=27405 RepID=UPI001C7119D8|nr:C-Jun-amino-terminal kinase-interacting protein 2-like isoform X2 [Penaeus japonicus]